MDLRLVAWARQVKARAHRKTRRGCHAPPPLWLFTDHRRLPDPGAVVAALPRGLAGVVFRHDGATGRAALALRLALICRERRLAFVVAGDWRLAARCHAGLHLRGGRDVMAPRWLARVSASAHGAPDIVRAAAAGAAAVFISPVFATVSHPGAAGLGPVRWAALAQLAPGRAAALGGLDGGRMRQLRRGCVAAGAVGALEL